MDAFEPIIDLVASVIGLLAAILEFVAAALDSRRSHKEKDR